MKSLIACTIFSESILVSKWVNNSIFTSLLNSGENTFNVALSQMLLSKISSLVIYFIELLPTGKQPVSGR
jgi:heptaprenylglyceryl phosphate synthase